MSPGHLDSAAATQDPGGFAVLGRLAARLWWTPPLIYLVVGCGLLYLSAWGTPWEQSALYLSSPVRYVTAVEPSGQVTVSHPDEAYTHSGETHHRGPLRTIYAPMIPTYVAELGGQRINLMATAYNGGAFAQLLGGVARLTGDGALIAVLVLVLLMGAGVQLAAVVYFHRTFGAPVAFYGGLWCALDLCSYGNYMAGIVTTAVVQLTLVPSLWILDRLCAEGDGRRSRRPHRWLPFLALGLLHGVALYNTVPHLIVMAGLLAGTAVATPRIVRNPWAWVAAAAGCAVVCWPMLLYPLDFPSSEGDSWSGNPLLFGTRWLATLASGEQAGLAELAVRNLHHLWLSLARPYLSFATIFGVRDVLGPDVLSFGATLVLVVVLGIVLWREPVAAVSRRLRMMAATVLAIFVLATPIAWNPANPHHIWYAWPLFPFLLTVAAFRLPALLGARHHKFVWARWLVVLPLLLAALHLGHVIYLASARGEMAQPAIDVRALRALADELEAAGAVEPVVVSDALIGVLDLTTSGRVRPLHLSDPFGVLGVAETWRRFLPAHTGRAYVFTLSGDVDEDHRSDRETLDAFLLTAHQLRLEPIPIASIALTSGADGFAIYVLRDPSTGAPTEGQRWAGDPNSGTIASP